MEEWKGVCKDSLVLTALLEQGFTAPTEIQKRTVPEVLLGKDVIGAAETVRKHLYAYIFDCGVEYRCVEFRGLERHLLLGFQLFIIYYCKRNA